MNNIYVKMKEKKTEMICIQFVPYSCGDEQFNSNDNHKSPFNSLSKHIAKLLSDKLYFVH